MIQDEIILLGKPLSEYTLVEFYLRDRNVGYRNFIFNARVYRIWYEEKRYRDIGRCITMEGNEFRITDEIIAYTRLFADNILHDADMTPIIPYIEEGLRFNIDYVKMLERVTPIFNEFEKYGYEGKYTIKERFHLEFWQGAFSNHWCNPDKHPHYK